MHSTCYDIADKHSRYCTISTHSLLIPWTPFLFSVTCMPHYRSLRLLSSTTLSSLILSCIFPMIVLSYCWFALRWAIGEALLLTLGCEVVIYKCAQYGGLFESEFLLFSVMSHDYVDLVDRRKTIRCVGYSKFVVLVESCWDWGLLRMELEGSMIVGHSRRIHCKIRSRTHLKQ